MTQSTCMGCNGKLKDTARFCGKCRGKRGKSPGPVETMRQASARIHEHLRSAKDLEEPQRTEMIDKLLADTPGDSRSLRLHKQRLREAEKLASTPRGRQDG